MRLRWFAALVAVQIVLTAIGTTAVPVLAQNGLYTLRLGNVEFLTPGNDVLTIRNATPSYQTAVQIMPHGDACQQMDLSAIVIYAQDVGPHTAGPFNRWSQRYFRRCGEMPLLELLEHYRDVPPSPIRVGWRDANTGAIKVAFTLTYTGTGQAVIDFNGNRLANYVTE